MCKILAFSAARKEQNDSEHPAELQCNPPILVKRTSAQTISVGFWRGCFNTWSVDLTMRMIAHGQKWRLTFIDKGHNLYDERHKTYAIRIFDYPEEEAFRIAVSQIMTQVCQEVYTEEISMPARDVSIRDLSVPCRYGPDNGAYISEKTARLLYRNGIANCNDLIRKTREKLARIPGMTTNEIYKIEKSLAVRGMFLLVEQPAVWSGNSSVHKATAEKSHIATRERGGIRTDNSGKGTQKKEDEVFPMPKLYKGMLVTHRRFGEGTVRNILDGGKKVVVRFASGEKTFVTDEKDKMNAFTKGFLRVKR